MFLWIGKGGRRRFSLSRSSELLDCPVRICWTLELLQWIERIMQPLGWFAQPVTWLHPERAPSGGTGGEREKEQELWSTFICTFLLCCSCVLVHCCFCACIVLGLESKLSRKKQVAVKELAQEKLRMYRLSYWWGIEALVWISFGSMCALTNLHPGATVLQQFELTWVSFDRVLQPSHVPLLIHVPFCTDLILKTNYLKRNTQQTFFFSFSFLVVKFTEPVHPGTKRVQSGCEIRWLKLASTGGTEVALLR